MHAGLKYTLIILIIYAGYCSFIFLMQRQMMFPRGLIPTPSGSAPKIPGIEQIWLDTGFGKVEAWFLPPESNAARHPSPVVIFGHGNAELIDFWPDELNTFTSFGMGLLLVEYPGYGRSAGKPSQESITQIFVAAYDMLAKRKEIDPSRILLFGRSLGGGAVCALAAKRPTRALILMSTFTSVRSFAGRYLVPKFLVRDPFDNIEVVRSYKGPILILHGKNDGVIPYSHGVKLHAAAPHSSFITYDAGHNDCPPKWPVFWKDIESFLVNNKIIANESP
jgi:pimeloyl-ACP methyl ester carboxylesterase